MQCQALIGCHTKFTLLKRRSSSEELSLLASEVHLVQPSALSLLVMRMRGSRAGSSSTAAEGYSEDCAYGVGEQKMPEASHARLCFCWPQRASMFAAWRRTCCSAAAKCSWLNCSAAAQAAQPRSVQKKPQQYVSCWMRFHCASASFRNMSSSFTYLAQQFPHAYEQIQQKACLQT